MGKEFYNSAKIQILSGNGLEETLKKLEKKYGPLSKEQIAVVEEIIRERKSKGPPKSLIKIFLVIALLLIGGGIYLLYLEFFAMSSYTNNTCDPTPIDIRLDGDKAFRLRITNILNFLMKNDACDIFLFIATNTKTIEQSSYWPVLLTHSNIKSQIKDGVTPIYSTSDNLQTAGFLYRATCVHVKISDDECIAMLQSSLQEYKERGPHIFENKNFLSGFNIDFNFLIQGVDGETP